MKIRTDFVTNSSSSSFLIAYKKIPDIDDETLARYPFIKMYPKMLDIVLSYSEYSYSETEAATIIDSKEKLDNYIIGMYGSMDDTIEDIFVEGLYIKEEYSKLINLMNDGYILFKKRIDDSDNTLCDILHYFAENNDDFIIFEG